AAVDPEASLPPEVLKALTDGKKFTVMSIDPKGFDAVPTYAWKVLASKEIDDAKIRKDVVDAIKKAVAKEALPAECFIPRHAISTQYEAKKYVLVICFQCSQMLVYIGGEQKQTIPISGSAKATLDKILGNADPVAAGGK
ncbi:MAG TPA: hypothetical protein VGG30_12040, partial [Pirellulales bacterium]